MSITYDEFKKVEIRAGKILSAEKVPNTDKLLKLMVDFGEKVAVIKSAEVQEGPDKEPEGGIAKMVEIVDRLIESKADENKSEDENVTVAEMARSESISRQIISGIALKFPDPAVLVGKTCMFVTNLEPRVIKGIESNGMLFAVSTPEGGFSLLEPNETILPGTLAA
jgi:tRNA-binding EMAP/Myf-like protein